MIAGGAVASALAQAAGLASLGLASIVLGRSLGTDGYGVFAIALNLAAILAITASIGLGNGIAFEMASGRWAPGSALRNALLASLLLGGIGAAVGALIIVVAGDSVLPGVSVVATVCLLAAIPGGVALLLLVGASTALERYEALGLMQFGQPFAIAAGASILGLAYGLDAAVAAIGLATVLIAGLGSLWAIRVARSHDRGPWSEARSRLGESARFGAKTWATDLLVLLNLRADLLLVGAMAGAGEAGLYGLAATLTSLGLIVPHALAWLILPRVASLEADQQQGSVGSVVTVGRAGRQATIRALATSIVLVGVILLVPTIYGSSFQGTVRLGLILVPGIAAFGLSRVFAYTLAGLNEPGTVLRRSTAVVVPTLIAYLVIIPWGGALGAAIVSTVSYFLIFLLLLRALSVRTGARPFDLVIPSRSDLVAYRELVPVLAGYVRSRGASQMRVTDVGGHGSGPRR